MRTMLAALLIAAVPACDSTTQPIVETRHWSATLQGTNGHDELVASVLVAAAQNFTAEIEIAGGEAESSYAWRIGEATCEAPGGVVGSDADYPEIETDGEGQGEAAAAIPATLDPEGDYHVSVYRVELEGEEEEEEEVEVMIACGVLEVED